MPRILSVANREFADAAAFYESEREGLGERFIQEVDEAYVFIDRFSKAAPRVLHPKVPSSVRCVLLRSFPYGVIFVEPELVVVAIASLRRRPAYWLRRLGRNT